MQKLRQAILALVQLNSLWNAIGAANPFAVSVFETVIFILNLPALKPVAILLTNNVLASDRVNYCINGGGVVDAIGAAYWINPDDICKRLAHLEAEKCHANFQWRGATAIRQHIVDVINLPFEKFF